MLTALSVSFLDLSRHKLLISDAQEGGTSRGRLHRDSGSLEDSLDNLRTQGLN